LNPLFIAIAFFASSIAITLSSKKHNSKNRWEKNVIAKIGAGMSSAYSILVTENVPRDVKFSLLRGARPEALDFKDAEIALAIKSREVSKMTAGETLPAYRQVSMELQQMLSEIEEMNNAARMRSQIICCVTAFIAPLLSKVGSGLFHPSNHPNSLLGFMLVAGASFFGVNHKSVKNSIAFMAFIAGIYFSSSYFTLLILK
jgi:hypothetical protein